jgi:hypothetical protein
MPIPAAPADLQPEQINQPQHYPAAQRLSSTKNACEPSYFGSAAFRRWAMTMHLNEIIMAGLAGSVFVSGVLVGMLGSRKSYTVLQVLSAVSLLAFSVACIGLMNNSESVLKQQVCFWAAVAAACVVAVGFLTGCIGCFRCSLRKKSGLLIGISLLIVPALTAIMMNG